MHRIDAWKTTDGKIYEAKDDAGSHQHEIDVKTGLQNILSTFYHPGICMDDLVDELFRVRFSMSEVLTHGNNTDSK